MSPNTLNDQRVVIVGGSSGIGLATAMAFADAGALVTVASRSADKLAAARERSAGRLKTAVVDGSDEAQIKAFLAGTAPIDHLVLCANAGGTIGPFAQLDLGAMRSYFDNKLWVYLNTLRHLANAPPRESVTLVNGAASRLAAPGMAALAVVNGGLDAIVRPLALEFAPARVNAIAPGVIDTPYWGKMSEADRAKLYEQAAAAVPVKRVGRDEDIARAVLFLATNSYITGVVLDVDGGRRLTPHGR
jgi:NAD(P)-dependent dehydrogenase (short-subunit alcohol dehydrogenase family)